MKTIHLITFDIPYPTNYGGAVDLFYKLKTINLLGVKPILHCFQYGGRRFTKKLHAHTEHSHYYDRQRSTLNHFSTLPFGIASRRNDLLMDRLLLDEQPILFDGLQSCALITHPKLKERKKIVRMHHIEWKYYKDLAAVETSPTKVAALVLESKKLKSYEQKVLKHADKILVTSIRDKVYFEQYVDEVIYVPIFHPSMEVTAEEGAGEFVLFHGNLHNKDNEQVAFYLIKNVFSDLQIPLIIAGARPSNDLRNLVADYPHIQVKGNLSQEGIADLIRTAHINVLLSRKNHGLKVKLLNALFIGRHCMVNDEMIAGTGLDDLCEVKNTAPEYKETIQNLMRENFGPELIKKRKEALELQFSNKINAQKIIDVLF